ncbi:MAG: imelysin family protein, partial [Pseudomonadota bacterium]
SITTYCGALPRGTNTSAFLTRAQAQNDFKTVMTTLQNTLMYGGWSDGGGSYGIGPVSEEFRLTQLYSWPLTSRCNIDLNLANNDPALKVAVNQRGLDALEHLLFVETDANHVCPDNFPIVHPQLNDFNALDAGEKESRRCAAMLTISADALSSAAALDSGWAADQGNFAATMAGSTNPGETLNHITDGMFYFEKLIKEDKLDKPTGGLITNNPPSCGIGQPCPDDVESPTARVSKENLIENMRAFQKLYLGGSSDPAAQLGFDDWLIEEGESALAASFSADIQSVIDALEAINGSLYDTIVNDIDTVNNLLSGNTSAPVKAVSDALRFEVMPALGLTLPQGSASDTD